MTTPKRMAGMASIRNIHCQPERPCVAVEAIHKQARKRIAEDAEIGIADMKWR